MTTKDGRAGCSEAAAGMRVGYVVSQYPATSHTFIRREVEALRGLGVAIATFSIRAPAPAELAGEADRAEAAGTYFVLRQGALAIFASQIAELVRNPSRFIGVGLFALRHRPPGLRALLLSTAHFAEAVVLAREARRRKIDHLHNHFANSGATVGLLASRLLRLPWSFTMHGISETDYPAGLLLADKVREARAVVSVSWFGRAQAMRLVEPEHWTKFQVIRCGLALGSLPHAAPRESGSGKTIVCVGRLSPEKGLAGLLRAFAEVQSDVTGVRLRLVGDGPDRQMLAKLADQLGIAEAVTFVGRLPEDQALREIADADIFVLPSFMEGLPIVLMEAMALGTPVVASRVAGIPELVADGSSGLLFTPARWDELESCIRRLLDDDALRLRLASTAKARVAEEFDARRSAEALARLFSGLARQSDRGEGSMAEKKQVTFGMREAIVLAIVGIGIAVAVALTQI